MDCKFVRIKLLFCLKPLLLYSYTILVFALSVSISYAETESKSDSVKIAAIFALSGKATSSNAPAVLGVQLAAKEINETGGILGRDVEIFFFDNYSTPIGSYLAAAKAVESGVDAIIGASWSSHSLAIAKIAQKHQIPMISPISTTPPLTGVGDYIFRVCYNDNFQGEALARFVINELKAETGIIFADITSDFSLNLSEIFSRTFTSLGGTIKQTIDYRAGQSDFSGTISKIQIRDVDIAFLSGHDESGLLAKNLKEAGIEAIPVGSDGWAAESFFTLGGDQITTGYFINHWDSLQNEPRSRWFVEKYRDYGPFMAPTPLSFDAMMMLALAIKRAESTHGQDIKNTLIDLRGFVGITGNIVFDVHGDASKQACIIKIDNGIPSLHKFIGQPQ